ncbi:Na/Pi symporter [Bacillus taeanensis]|uniref:Na/Pi cotransporter family protein n=1 Tax=Bacillus taeanensis TaxID=273032 RepID=A0A366XVT1_9BACI|nr:Na/Pi symporter [Bacillus taeanensis]RBW70500.1 Na/Pi cotransporter family protein [Bacillus taeanensis]
MPEVLSLMAIFVGIFLFGMTVIRIGLQTASKKHMQVLLMKMTDTPLKGLITGTIVTAIMQSSSAVLVITVGLVAAGFLTFKQSIGIILGVNIGTTFTNELLTLDPSSYLPFLLIGGTALILFNYRLLFSVGCLFFGLGCIFVAMQGFESLADPLSSTTAFTSFLTDSNENIFLGVGIGTLLTAIIQSSTATTGIVMGLLNHHLLTLPAAIAIVLGANIGTCITAYLASIGTNIEAKLVAYAHIWLNILGVLLFLPIIKQLSFITEQLTSFPDVQIAHASLIFNLLSSLLALPFAGLLASLLLKIHKKRPS